MGTPRSRGRPHRDRPTGPSSRWFGLSPEGVGSFLPRAVDRVQPKNRSRRRAPPTPAHHLPLPEGPALAERQHRCQRHHRHDEPRGMHHGRTLLPCVLARPQSSIQASLAENPEPTSGPCHPGLVKGPGATRSGRDGGEPPGRDRGQRRRGRRAPARRALPRRLRVQRHRGVDRGGTGGPELTPRPARGAILALLL
jgi:hypothetical protein